MVRRIGGGRGLCGGGQEKEWTGCFLDDLIAFGINADQWTTAAQDEGECRGTFHGEMDSYRENQGWTTACSRMPECDGKDQGEGSPKQADSCWFARHKWRERVSSGSLVCRCHDVLLRCYVCFLKKNKNRPRPSEHPPVRKEKMSKRLGGIKGCKT